jgi:RHS repeat-associated protein
VLGLHFYGARWYDSLLGRFIQADTVVPDQLDSQSFDRYAYVGNNPVKYIDPSGRTGNPSPLIDGYCSPTSCGKNKTKLNTNSNYLISILPVHEQDINWIQWFGATETAYEDHLKYQTGKSNYNYDGYCQGYHCGIDFGADWGTTIHSCRNGVVSKKGLGNGGHYVIINYGDYQILYQALDGDFKVNEGKRVVPGTVIAGVGNHSADPVGGNYHLHIEVRSSSSGEKDYKDRILNPLLLMDVSLYQKLLSISNLSTTPRNNVMFYESADQDPLKQQSPIVRGGSVLWK